MSTYVPGMVASVISTINWIATALGAEVSAITLSGAFSLLATSIWAALSPLLPFIALGALLAVAIFEIGKAFGWWTDVGSMLDAISAGAQRLWSAFINHPDVQAAIQAVSSALQTLWGYIQQAGQAIMEFFGIATGGEFDVVRAIIDGVGAAWEIFSGHLTAVVTVFTTLISIFQAVGEAIGGAFQWLYSGAVSLGSYLSDVLSPAFLFLSALWGTLVEAVQPIVTVFQQFQDGQVGLVDVITTVASSLWNVWTILSSNLSNLILTLVGNLLTWAIQGGLNFLTGLLTYLSQLPGRILTYLTSVKLQIMAQMAAWVLLAKLKASELINGVISFLSQLPGRVLSQLVRVVYSIVSAGAQWVSNARNKASEIVSGVVGILSGLPGQISSALSGVVSAITQPFRSAYDSVCSIVDNIKSKVQDGLSSLSQITGFGGDTAAGGDMPSAYGGDIVPANVEYTRSGNSTVTVEGEVTERLILDFQNVPSHIDTNQLIEVMQDRRVLESIARNRDFQSIDSKVKNEIIGKSKRYYGV